MRLRVPIALVLAALASSGCGSHATKAQSVVAATQKQLRTVTSADLRLRVELGSTLGAASQKTGFVLSGPLSLDPKTGPLADIHYRRLSSSAAATPDVEVIVDRTAGRVSIHGAGQPRTVPLGSAAIAQLRSSVGGSASGNGPFSRLHLADWVRRPQLERRGSTDVVSGALDLGAAVRDLVAVARSGSSAVPQPSDDELARLTKLVRDSSFQLVSTHAGHVLRSLRIDFALTPGRKTTLGSLVLANGYFELDLSRVNQPVRLP